VLAAGLLRPSSLIEAPEILQARSEETSWALQPDIRLDFSLTARDYTTAFSRPFLLPITHVSKSICT
jgi:predicted NAD/FAD-binding protein